MSEAYVYIYREDGPIAAGLLETVGSGREAGARFRYGRRYLLRQDRVEIDPVQLPFPETGADWVYATNEGFELFNGLRDVAPDGWGRHLMDRAAGTHTLSEFDYLVATGESRVGALAFGPDLTGPHRIVAWRQYQTDTAEETDHVGEDLDLKGMLEAVRVLDSAEDMPRKYARFLVRGSSLGGARPKAATEHRGKDCIAKFGRANDRIPMCRIEYITMKLAEAVQIRVPYVSLERVYGQDIYLIERFDRVKSEDKTQRLPFISGLTLLGAHESESPRQSYRGLAEQLRRFGSEPTRDAKELWRRMVFNILCNNTDDHLRNHGFLWDGRGWRLSPAYDIVSFPQVGTERDLAIGVGRFERTATIHNALTEVASFGISPDEAIAIARTMQAIMKSSWEKLCADTGFTIPEIERLRTCFIACDETIAQST